MLEDESTMFEYVREKEREDGRLDRSGVCRDEICAQEQREMCPS